MRKSVPVLGHFYTAIYYEYEPDKTLWGQGEIGSNGYNEIGVKFRYKQQDASRQGVGFVGDETNTYQPISGYQTERKEFRIVTNNDLPFKSKDKILREIDNKVYRINKVVKDKTVTNSLLALRFPRQNNYQTSVLELVR